jgi:hypothetical protein
MGLNIEYRSPKTWKALLIRHATFIFHGIVLAKVQFILPLGIAHTLGTLSPLFILILQKFLFHKASI